MENEFEVEKILRRRVVKNKIKFLLKWLHFDNSHNKWVDATDLNCPDLLDDFLIHKVLAARRSGNQIEYLLKWKYGKEPSPMLSSELRLKWPILLIHFLENIILWTQSYPSTRENEIPNLSEHPFGDPVKVSYVTRVSGPLMYWVVWSSGESKLIPSEEASMLWPELIITYLEQNLKFD